MISTKVHIAIDVIACVYCLSSSAHAQSPLGVALWAGVAAYGLYSALCWVELQTLATLRQWLTEPKHVDR